MSHRTPGHLRHPSFTPSWTLHSPSQEGVRHGLNAIFARVHAASDTDHPPKKKRRRGRPGVARPLAEHPDRVIEATLDACPHCSHSLGPAEQAGVHAYDHVELPPIRPVVTRIHRHHGSCPCCHRRVTAPAPEGFAPGSPFGPGLCALIIHLHVTQAISFERLSRLLGEVFGVAVSEGSIANILARAQQPLVTAAVPIAAAVRASAVVGSDETSARVDGKTWWQWVLLSSTAICYVIVPQRAASIIVDFLEGRQPEIWVADRYAAQDGHGAARQLCLAHYAAVRIMPTAGSKLAPAAAIAAMGSA